MPGLTVFSVTICTDQIWDGNIFWTKQLGHLNGEIYCRWERECIREDTFHRINLCFPKVSETKANSNTGQEGVTVNASPQLGRQGMRKGWQILTSRIDGIWTTNRVLKKVGCTMSVQAESWWGFNKEMNVRLKSGKRAEKRVLNDWIELNDSPPPPRQ